MISLDDCCGSGCKPCIFDVATEPSETKITRDDCNIRIRHDLLSPIKYNPFFLEAVQKHTTNANFYTFKPKIEGTMEGVLPLERGQHFILTNKNFGEMEEERVLNGAKVDKGNQKKEEEESKEAEEKKAMEKEIIEKKVGKDKKKRKDEKMSSGRQLPQKGVSPEILPGPDFPPDDKTVFSRAYTPLDVGEEGRVKFLVKLYPNGAASRFLSGLRLGDEVYMRGPFGGIRPFQHCVAFCAGTGVAPVFSIFGSVVEREDQTVRLFFACAAHDIFLREELRTLSKFWNVNVTFYVTAREGFEVEGRFDEDIRHGRIDANAVRSALQSDCPDLVLICGTPAFNEDVTGFARMCGAPESRIQVLE